MGGGQVSDTNQPSMIVFPLLLLSPSPLPSQLPRPSPLSCPSPWALASPLPFTSTFTQDRHHGLMTFGLSASPCGLPISVNGRHGSFLAKQLSCHLFIAMPDCKVQGRSTIFGLQLCHSYACASNGTYCQRICYHKSRCERPSLSWRLLKAVHRQQPGAPSMKGKLVSFSVLVSVSDSLSSWCTPDLQSHIHSHSD